MHVVCHNVKINISILISFKINKSTGQYMYQLPIIFPDISKNPRGLRKFVILQVKFIVQNSKKCQNSALSAFIQFQHRNLDSNL